MDRVFADVEHIVIGKHDASVDYLDDLKQAYSIAEENSAERMLLEKRINYLNGKISIISSGGRSDIERKERKDRMEDAVLAVRSALEEGVVEGGGMALHKIYKKYKDKNKFIECINVPHKLLKLRDPNYKVTAEIIDPMKVTRCSILNAISVTKTLLSMEAVVLNDRLWT